MDNHSFYLSDDVTTTLLLREMRKLNLENKSLPESFTREQLEQLAQDFEKAADTVKDSYHSNSIRQRTEDFKIFIQNYYKS